MDLNLDTLKREILEYLDSAGFAVFHSTPGLLEGMPMVAWDTAGYPDYQQFLEVARKAGARIVIFSTREFDATDLEDLTSHLEDCDLTREERREYTAKLRKLEMFEGTTCTLELAFDHHSRMYVYDVRPDWYEEFLEIEDEILSGIPGEDDLDDSLGGYFSKN